MKGIDLELQSEGSLSIESDKLQPGYWKGVDSSYRAVQLGLKISQDGRLWVCIDGECVLRFKSLFYNKKE